MPTLDWIGKKAVVDHHREVPLHLLRDRPELSVGEPCDGNLLIQGDNLLALKALLPYYAGRVKCIYIDPPYNTGNEGWVYNDAVNSPEIRKWLGEVVGREAEDLSRHDKWLCMMYPRLMLLKEFLREDGIILISVDGNEHRFLEVLMDEVFGAWNRIETFIWKKSYGGGAKSKHVVNLHEYILCFARNRDVVPELHLPPDPKVLKYYKFSDDKLALRGPYRLQPLATTSMDPRPNLRYPIPYRGEEIWPEKQWQWSRERALEALANDELVIRRRKGTWTVSYKQYLRDPEGVERSQKPYSIIDGIYTQQGTVEIKAIFGDGKAFGFPKPSALIKYLVRATTEPGDLVLDSFAGSGTTGHAVMQLNAEEGGQRRFILCEMDGEIARTITSERLRRAREGYGTTPGVAGGFRYCELGPTLFDASGQIREAVTYEELARHVFFVETGEPLPEGALNGTPLLGVSNGTAVYLLYNGILGDRSRNGGNALTREVLESLPPHDGPRVIYGTSRRVSPEAMRRADVVFRQTPYEIRTR
jgi:DNA modification methylase